MSQSSHNFGFLESHDPTLARLATLAEKYFADDPNTALVKLRQFGELLAQQVAAYAGAYDARTQNQADLLGRLKYTGVLTPRAADLFHTLRKVGNVATHDGGAGTHSDALQALKIAREAAIWMHRSYGRVANFNPGPFVPPLPPENPAEALAKELERLRGELDAAQSTAAEARAAAQEQAQLLVSAEARAQKEAEDREFYAKYAEETERELHAKAAALAELQATAERATQNERREQQQAAEQADAAIDLDEAATRRIIDEALRVRGWEADSERIAYGAGVRPHKSRNLAIAEWPTASGPVDYALFCGLTLRMHSIPSVSDPVVAIKPGVRVDRAPRGLSVPGPSRHARRQEHGRPWSAAWHLEERRSPDTKVSPGHRRHSRNVSTSSLPTHPASSWRVACPWRPASNSGKSTSTVRSSPASRLVLAANPSSRLARAGSPTTV